jgi:hypothetical protein
MLAGPRRVTNPARGLQVLCHLVRGLDAEAIPVVLAVRLRGVSCVVACSRRLVCTMVWANGCSSRCTSFGESPVGVPFPENKCTRPELHRSRMCAGRRSGTTISLHSAKHRRCRSEAPLPLLTPHIHLNRKRGQRVASMYKPPGLQSGSARELVARYKRHGVLPKTVAINK